jgi:hypothetical protein
VPCQSCENRRFGRKHRLHLQGRNIRERRKALEIARQKGRLSQDAHGATFRKAPFLIVTAVNPYHPTRNMTTVAHSLKVTRSAATPLSAQFLLETFSSVPHYSSSSSSAKFRLAFARRALSFSLRASQRPFIQACVTQGLSCALCLP